MPFHQTQLANGLTIVAESNDDAASVACGFFVKTGSRDELPHEAGLSHFLEHMAFKGTGRRSSSEVNLDFDRIGADYNAGTTEENTIFYAAVLPDFQARAIDLLADILQPALRQEDFDTEKKVILEEIALYDDQPRVRVYDGLMAEHFRGHPLGNIMLGNRESISAMRRQDMLDYFRRRYCPSNIAVAACGRLDWQGLVAQVTELCARWAPGSAQRLTPPPPADFHRNTLVDPNVLRQHVGIISPAPSAQDDRRHAAQLMATIVGDATGSRLYYAIVEPALVDECSMSYSPMDGAGAMVTFFSADNDKAARALEVVQDQFAEFMEKGPTAAELAAAKNKIASSATLKGELPMGRLSDVGFDWIYRRRYQPLAEEIEEMFAVAADEVTQVARQCRLDQFSLLALGPEKVL